MSPHGPGRTTIHRESSGQGLRAMGMPGLLLACPALPGYCRVTAHAQADVVYALTRPFYSSQGAFHDLISAVGAVWVCDCGLVQVSFFVMSEIRVIFIMYH